MKPSYANTADLISGKKYQTRLGGHCRQKRKTAIERAFLSLAFGSNRLKLPFANGNYVSRPEIVITEKWSRQLDGFVKTGIEAGSRNT
ncbi:hypothetical protein [Pseudomonas moorei]|uniref:hypothetical protein n=1 Tax=Pseudomonas moorei TaxID=395599 RepID=UPI001FF4A5E9|nr:hypothetical protein [Pseudomonas moorei]